MDDDELMMPIGMGELPETTLLALDYSISASHLVFDDGEMLTGCILTLVGRPQGPNAPTVEGVFVISPEMLLGLQQHIGETVIALGKVGAYG